MSNESNNLKKFVVASVGAAILTGGLSPAGAATAKPIAVQVGNGAPLVPGGKHPIVGATLLSTKPNTAQAARVNAVNGKQTAAVISPAVRNSSGKRTAVGARTPGNTIGTKH